VNGTPNHALLQRTAAPLLRSTVAGVRERLMRVAVDNVRGFIDGKALNVVS